jgi:glycerate kinase
LGGFPIWRISARRCISKLYNVNRVDESDSPGYHFDIVSAVMTILLAPDKFKGSLAASQVCDAMKEAFAESGKDIEFIVIPMADGGEGTADMLTVYTGGTMIKVMVLDPFFREVEASYGISGDGKIAFVEMASASGLQLLKPEERNPLRGTTFGTGQLISSALDHGVTSIILGVGGSATNDGGIGMGKALGARFLDKSGSDLEPTGENLINIGSIDLKRLHPGLKSISVTAICDVDNPLTGTHGAAHVFGPQKGASPEDIKLLDDGLRNLAGVAKAQTGIDLEFPGAGAGGGLGGGSKLFFNVSFQPGMQFVSQFIKLGQSVKSSDLVVTGEGKMDEQTLSGKVVKGVADVCRTHNKPLIVVVGKNELAPEKVGLLGIKKVVALIDGNTPHEEAFNDTFRLIKKRIREEVVPFFL